MKHKCPKNGCERMVPHSTLACRSHWYQVSQETRSWVLSAWANLRNDPEDYMAARKAAVEEMNRT